MEKIDFKKLLPKLYAPKDTRWHEVDVPKMQFLMIDGKGNPNTSVDYQAAVETLYSVAYTVKFMSKRELDKDYVVPPLEGLWYAEDMNVFVAGNKDAFQWTMMIMQPEWITQEFYKRGVEIARQKRSDLPYDALRLDTYYEGRSLQRLHIGSYNDEAPSLAQLHHEIMPERSLNYNGNHHEIYLSDPRKVSSEKLKTILRQPIKEN